MKFYTIQHQFYCGIDLHTDWMYLCVIDAEGVVRLHKNIRTEPEAFLRAVKPFRDDLVVCAECMFTWYWLADLCEDEGIPFVLGHALYMRAIHGGKAKNDKIDSHKIAVLLRGGMIPCAYVYPRRMRATRDLLRRRNHLVRKRAELYAHIQNTASQYNLAEPLGRIAKSRNRRGLLARFGEGSVQKNMAVDLALIEFYDPLIKELEQAIEKTAQGHDPVALALLRTIPGVGQILALVMLYETEDIARFPRVQDFVSYCRLVKSARESNGKKKGPSGKKIGNAHLKWAFSEAAAMFLKNNEPAKAYLAKLANRHGKGKALSILAHKLGRAVYFMLKNQVSFDQEKFLAA
ncbi:MAG: IS110 family transposase [Desulfuromonadales bacterium]|nr:MAG: IS110 family transposase [Desulfuromonadales bacterium]